MHRGDELEPLIARTGLSTTKGPDWEAREDSSGLGLERHGESLTENLAPTPEKGESKGGQVFSKQWLRTLTMPQCRIKAIKHLINMLKSCPHVIVWSSHPNG